MRLPLRHNKIRNDSMGQGAFGSKRGDHIHNGIDIICIPGEFIHAPVTSRYTRIAYPYAEHEYAGMVLQSEHAIYTIFYIDPAAEIGAIVQEGDIIATAQDISRKYGPDMTPHIHLKVVMDPVLLFQLGGCEFD